MELQPLLVIIQNEDFFCTDPDVMDLPLLKKPYHFYQDKTQAPQILQDTNKLIAEADGYVIITAEYNHCLPPALLNLMDYFPGSSYKYRPASIVSYSMGPYGGQRAAMQARALLGELGCPSTSFLFAIPQIQNSFDQEGKPTNDRMETGADKLIEELEWYATALRIHRDKYGKPAK